LVKKFKIPYLIITRILLFVKIKSYLAPQVGHDWHAGKPQTAQNRLAGSLDGGA
jgi:hypothetical protein